MGTYRDRGDGNRAGPSCDIEAGMPKPLYLSQWETVRPSHQTEESSDRETVLLRKTSSRRRLHKSTQERSLLETRIPPGDTPTPPFRLETGNDEEVVSQKTGNGAENS